MQCLMTTGKPSLAKQVGRELPYTRDVVDSERTIRVGLLDVPAVCRGGYNSNASKIILRVVVIY